MNQLLPLLICLLPLCVSGSERTILDCNDATETLVREGYVERYSITNFTVAYDSEGVSFGNSFRKAAVTKLPGAQYSERAFGGFTFESLWGIIQYSADSYEFEAVIDEHGWNVIYATCTPLN